MAIMEEETAKSSPLQAALDDLHNVTADVEHRLGTLHRRLGPVLAEAPENDENASDLAAPRRHVDAVTNIGARLNAVSVRLSKITQALEV